MRELVSPGPARGVTSDTCATLLLQLDFLNVYVFVCVCE